MPKGVYKRTEKSKNFLGRKHSLATRLKLSEIKLHHPVSFWLGKKRDDFDFNGSKNPLLGWRSHPELRYIVNNGITLCHAHHPFGRENEAKLSPYFQELVAEKKFQ